MRYKPRKFYLRPRPPHAVRIGSARLLCQKFFRGMAETVATEVTTNYEDEFDPSSLVARYYYTEAGIPSRAKHMLRCYHEAFQTLPSSGLKILDYGSGPIMFTTISAAPKASEIVLSDYAHSNCKALQQWLDKDPAALDWSPHFNFVVQELEGKGEKEAAERQELVRKVTKAVVHCDLTQDPPIEKGYDQPYDVVVSSLVLEALARTDNEFVAYAARLGKLVKPGGTLMLYGVENNQGYYTVGENKFYSVSATAEFAMKTLTDVGFSDLILDTIQPVDDPVKTKIYRFIKGIRNV